MIYSVPGLCLLFASDIYFDFFIDNMCKLLMCQNHCFKDLYFRTIEVIDFFSLDQNGPGQDDD